MNRAPVAIFAYNRLEHLQRTVAALAANEGAGETDLVVFSDGSAGDTDASAVAAVRGYLETIHGFRSVRVIRRPYNWGLSKSIISGVTEMCALYGRVIVVEDDLLTAPYFLRYMNEALRLYEQDEQVAAIQGYAYHTRKPLPQTFLMQGVGSWGWATWKRAWDKFDADGSHLLSLIEGQGMRREFDLEGAYPYTQTLRDQVAGRNDSWAIRWRASVFLSGQLALHPGRSLVQNIGFDGSGTHCGAHSRWSVPLADQPVEVRRQAIQENMKARRAVTRGIWRARFPSLWKRYAAKLLASLREHPKLECIVAGIMARNREWRMR